MNKSAIVGKIVFNRQFGEGIITDIVADNNQIYLAVKFGQDTPIFVFPSCFNNAISSEDAELNKFVNIYLNNIMASKALKYELLKAQSDEIIDARIKQDAEKKRKDYQPIKTIKKSDEAWTLKWDGPENQSNQESEIIRNESLNKMEEMITYLTDERHVKYFIHFTREENLQTILDCGIYSRKSMPPSIKPVYSDDYRIDGLPDFISFSISYPNYKMLFTKNQKRKYVILAIDVNCLREFYERDCLFYTKNAAAGGPTSYTDYFTGINRLMKMFEDDDRGVRALTKIPAYYTTNPQAEVQLRGKISPQYIKQVHFNGSQLQPVRITVETITNSPLFKPRCDWVYWQQG